MPAQREIVKVCTADWNGDGKLDLLVGDVVYLKTKLPHFTAAQKAEHEKLRKRQQALNTQFTEAHKEFQKPNRKKPTPEERRKKQEELSKLYKELSDIYNKLPREQETHGFVCVYLRQ